MHNLKAIIFDVDGTLANTEETHRQAFNVAFEEFGLEYHWPVEDYISLLSISGGRERILSFLKSSDCEAKSELALREYALQLHQRKSEIYRGKLTAGHIGLRNGVKRLINEAITNDIKLAIATATSHANVETLMKNNLGNNALSCFSAIVTSDTIKDKKPSPVVYQFALAELGLEPEHCVAIEDSRNGNLSALGANLNTIITTHAFTMDNDFSGASLVIDQLGEPGDPFHVKQGASNNNTFVDLKLLDKILSVKKKINVNQWSDSVAACAK